MNVDLFNFHTRSTASLLATSSPATSSCETSDRNHLSIHCPQRPARREHDLASHHSSREDPTVVSSPNQYTLSVHSLACVDIGSSASLFSFQLRFADAGVLQLQGFPVKTSNLCSSSSAGIASRPVAICSLKPGPRLTPICVDRLPHEPRHDPNPDRVAYVVQGLRHVFFCLGLNHPIHLMSASGNMSSAFLNSQVIDNYLQSEV